MQVLNKSRFLPRMYSLDRVQQRVDLYREVYLLFISMFLISGSVFHLVSTIELNVS